MRLKKIIEAADAVAVIHNGDTVASSGYAGSGTPDQLFVSLEQRFLESGSPRDLTLVFSTGQGDMKDKGLNRLANEGLVRRVIGGYFGLSPKLEKLIVDNRIEAYNLPEGCSRSCTATSARASLACCRMSGWAPTSIHAMAAAA